MNSKVVDSKVVNSKAEDRRARAARWRTERRWTERWRQEAVKDKRGKGWTRGERRQDPENHEGHKVPRSRGRTAGEGKGNDNREGEKEEGDGDKDRGGGEGRREGRDEGEENCSVESPSNIPEWLCGPVVKRPLGARAMKASLFSNLQQNSV